MLCPSLQARIGEGFLDLAARLRQEERPWRVPVPLEDIGGRAMGNSPWGEPLVALHSNPGPEHTFVHPETGRFSGLIDFGDASISHPAFDLRRWAGLSDWDAIWQGYTGEEPVSDGFVAVWRALRILANVGAMAAGGDSAAAAEGELQQLAAI